MSNQVNLTDMSDVTFSQASEAGLTHSDSLDGRMIGPSGRDPALVSHSVQPEKARVLLTNGTYGPLFDGSSPSADLQSCLESRLRRNLDVNGSPEYALTWKQWDMRSGPPICALRASGRRTSGNDYTGWRTPKAVEIDTGNEYMTKPSGNIRRISNGGDRGLSLSEEAQLAGWPTATARDHKDGTTTSCANVPDNALLGRVALGAVPSGTSAETEGREGYRLNPRFSLWLMGYPDEWASCGERAMQSCRKSRRRS
jgi:hypothetical protein